MNMKLACGQSFNLLHTNLGPSPLLGWQDFGLALARLGGTVVDLQNPFVSLQFSNSRFPLCHACPEFVTIPPARLGPH